MRRPRTTKTRASNPIKEDTKTPTFLDFNQYAFQESATKGCKINQTKLVLDFINHIEETLNRHSSKVDELNLVVRFNRLVREEGDVTILRWLNHAINNKIKILTLSYHTNPNYGEGWRYALPESLYRASSLQTLDLFGCQFLKPGPEIRVKVHLKKLKLARVSIDQELLQNLIEGCRSLEELCIDLCEGFEVVKVRGNRLELVDLYLERDGVQIVEVKAGPRLRRVSYAGGLKSVQGSFLASDLHGVKELRFHDVNLEVGFLQKVIGRNHKLEMERCLLIN